MEDCQLGTVERAIYAKSNLDRGGSVENILGQAAHGGRGQGSLDFHHRLPRLSRQ